MTGYRLQYQSQTVKACDDLATEVTEDCVKILKLFLKFLFKNLRVFPCFQWQKNQPFTV